MPDHVRTAAQNKETAHHRPAHQPAQSVVADAAPAEPALFYAIADPAAAPAGAILSLQRLAGNQVVSRHLQAKLRVGAVADPLEAEADQAAERVLGTPLPAFARAGAAAAQRAPIDEEEIQGKRLLQRAGPEEEEPLQGKRLLQRAGPEDDERLQCKRLLQRAGPEEEEPIQGKPLLQRAGPEEEEPLQGKRLLQRAGPEEEEPLQGKRLLQRAGPEEEEPIQGKRLLQRAGPEEEEPLQGKRLLQRAGPEEEEPLQGKPAAPAHSPGPAGEPSGSFQAGSDVERGIDLERRGGTPLAPEVAGYMEPRFGADFGQVRVHTSDRAASLSRQISAQAFTHGSDIFMPASAYDPGSTAGKRLLAHELAHVVQQGGAGALRKPAAPGGVVQRLGGKKFTGQVPKTGHDTDAYVKFLLANPDLLSDKERVFYETYMGQPLPKKGETEEPKEEAPVEPSKWAKFKALFAKKPKTLPQRIAGQLEKEFKGYAGIKGFFTGTRKAQALQKEQFGRLTEAQERNIDTLAELDPGLLTKLGFLLPSEAEAKSHDLLFKSEEMGKLPAKQQMQIVTYQSRLPMSAPKPASKEDQRKLQELNARMEQARLEKEKGKEKTGIEPPKPGTDLSGLAKTEIEKRGKEPPTVDEQLPETVDVKGGMPSLSKVVIKPGKKGEETTAHNVGSYRDAAADMVRGAQVHRGTIGQTAEMLTTDYVDVEEGERRYDELAEQKRKADTALKGLNEQPEKLGATAKLKKDIAANVVWAEKSQKSLLGYLHEANFAKAAQDSKSRAERAQKSSVNTTQETATVEYLYDQVQAKKDAIAARKKKATRAQKKDAAFNLETARMEAQAADESKTLLQQARLSMHVVNIARKTTDDEKTFVQKKLDRFPGALRKLGCTIVSGILSGIVGTLTFGMVGVKSNASAKGYMGKGLEKKGWPFKATFLNDIRNQIAQFKTAVTARPGGPSVLDVMSAVLRAFNEIVVQNVINISAKLALITGLLATILSAAAAVTFGATAPAAGILATISSIATYVALIAAAVKAAVAAVRLTLDTLTLLLNQDAKVSNFVRSRAKQSGMETMSDVTQVVTSAVATPTSEVIKGREFTNMFDPTKVINMNVSNLTATSPGMLKTVLGTGAGTGIGTGVPLVMGPIAQGIKGGADEPYGLYTQHVDDSGPRPPTKLGGGFLPPSKSQNRLTAPSKPTRQPTPVDHAIPKWMREALEQQNQLRAATLKASQAKAIGEVTAITGKVGDLASKLGSGKNESDKLDTQVKEAKSTEKGKDLMDEESVEMSHQQQGVLSESHGATTGMLAFLAHSKEEVRKLGEEPKKE